VSVSPPATTATTVNQKILRVDPRKKRDALLALLSREQVKNAFIFCNRKKDVGTLAESLRRHNVSAVALHGDMPQSKRDEALEKFRNNEIPFMVCSDVAARGLDIKDVDAVFNFDVPFSADDYVHRIGRTGRAGTSGKAFMFVTPDDAKLLQNILSLIRKDITEITLDGVAASVSAPVAQEQRAERQARPPQSRPPRDHGRGRAPQSPSPPRETKEPRKRDGDVNQTVGFGEDLPKFLTKTRVVSESTKEDRF
jgi:superfamily II DNA/RNA helicase